jgi:Cu2+-exporting ATPase/Cu+-exporting ATPase
MVDAHDLGVLHHVHDVLHDPLFCPEPRHLGSEATYLAFRTMTAVAIECRHCGLPINARTDSPFCCYGCEIVYDVLSKNPGEHDAGITKLKLIVGLLLGINVMVFSMPLYTTSLQSFVGGGSESFFSLLGWLSFAFATPVFMLLGMPYLESGLRALTEGHELKTDFLIAIGITAAYLLSAYNVMFGNGPIYFETGVAILLIVTMGKYLEASIRGKAQVEIQALKRSVPEQATKLDEHDREIEVSAAQLVVGDRIVLKAGQIMPADVEILSGSASIGQSELTGEAEPILVKKLDRVLAGSINYDGLLTCRVIHAQSESFVARMSDLLHSAKQMKAPIQEVADRVSKIAVPIVFGVSVLSTIYWWITSGMQAGIFAGLSVLLIACPCAIGIATPAALWISLTVIAHKGILCRSLTVLERLSHIRTVFFDKTGTLTAGRPTLVTIDYNDSLLQDRFAGNPLRLLGMIHQVESASRHPLALAAVAALPEQFETTEMSDFVEVPGRGVRARLGNEQVWVGNQAFTDDANHLSWTMKERDLDPLSSSLWCAIGSDSIDREVACHLEFKDEFRPNVKKVVEELQQQNYRVQILSGDRAERVQLLQKTLHTEVLGGLEPKDKVEIVSRTQSSLFVGDGINDAPAVAAATVGMAMGSGMDLTRSEADVILLNGDLEHVPHLLQLSKKTMRIVKQNLAWAFVYNIAGVVLAACGLLTPVWSALAMTFSSLAVMQNSLRVKKLKV